MTAPAPTSLRGVLLSGAELLDEQLRGVAERDWSRPTPCPDWDVEALVRHCADTADRAVALVQGTTWEASTSTAGPQARWRESSAQLRDVLAPAPLDKRWPLPDDSPDGKLRFHACDFAVHRWDVAVALGQEHELPQPWVDFMDGFFRGLPTEVLRRPRAFSDPLEARELDGPTRRLMAFLGRRPQD